MSGILCAHFGGSAPELVLNISNLAYPNISSRLAAANWDGIAPVRLVVDPGAMVNTLAIPAISFPNEIYLLIGAGALVGGVGGINAQSGGDALQTSVPIKIENHGSIKGGGGQGGSGGRATVRRFASTSVAQGGAPGDGQGFFGGSLSIFAATNGSPGDTQTNTTPSGPGEWITGDSGSALAVGGNGGSGGGWRTAGSSGQPGGYAGSYSAASAEPGQPGTLAGLNVRGLEFVTWILRGDA